MIRKKISCVSNSYFVAQLKWKFHSAIQMVWMLLLTSSLLDNVYWFDFVWSCAVYPYWWKLLENTGASSIYFLCLQRNSLRRLSRSNENKSKKLSISDNNKNCIEWDTQIRENSHNKIANETMTASYRTME